MIRLFNIFFVSALCILAIPSLRADSQFDYFSDPKLYSFEELVQEQKEKTLDMCWNFGQGNHLRFVSRNDEVYFELCLGLLPDIYDDFMIRMKDRFIVNDAEGSKRLLFCYKINKLGEEEINIPRFSQKKEHPGEYSYIVTDRRVVENAHPQPIGHDELTSIIRDRNVLFYTGAGVSLASEVPAMNKLNELLGLEADERFLFSLESALESPKEFASKILAFHRACLFSAPTKAHLALKELAVFKNIRLITENLDCLHEASGVYPYRINAKFLREEIGGECLAQFDYIICMGLSFDDRGFLGWYKQHNPQGKIIALDLNQPSYLGDEDYFLAGDLQEVIPAIQKAILKGSID